MNLILLHIKCVFSEFHFFNFNGIKYRLEAVLKKGTIAMMRAESEDEDIPLGKN